MPKYWIPVCLFCTLIFSCFVLFVVIFCFYNGVVLSTYKYGHTKLKAPIYAFISFVLCIFFPFMAVCVHVCVGGATRKGRAIHLKAAAAVPVVSHRERTHNFSAGQPWATQAHRTARPSHWGSVWAQLSGGAHEESCWTDLLRLEQISQWTFK